MSPIDIKIDIEEGGLFDKILEERLDYDKRNEDYDKGNILRVNKKQYTDRELRDLFNDIDLSEDIEIN